MATDDWDDADEMDPMEPVGHPHTRELIAQLDLQISALTASIHAAQHEMELFREDVRRVNRDVAAAQRRTDDHERSGQLMRNDMSLLTAQVNNLRDDFQEFSAWLRADMQPLRETYVANRWLFDAERGALASLHRRWPWFVVLGLLGIVAALGYEVFTLSRVLP